MTEIDLDAIEARVEAATSGPWVVESWPNELNDLGRSTFPQGVLDRPDGTRRMFDDTATIMTGWDHPQIHGPVPIVTVANSPYFERQHWIHFMNAADATFVANARTDVPALVERVRELEAELARGENALHN